MPAEQALVDQLRIIALRGIEHHFDDALNIAVAGGKPPGVHAEPARERGSHFVLIEDLALDFA